MKDATQIAVSAEMKRLIKELAVAEQKAKAAIALVTDVKRDLQRLTQELTKEMP